MNLSPTLPAAKGKGGEAMVMRACPTRQNILQYQYDLRKKHRPEGLPGFPAVLGSLTSSRVFYRFRRFS